MQNQKPQKKKQLTNRKSNVEQIAVFKCEVCGKLNENEAVIATCLKKHEVLNEKKSELKRFNEAISAHKDYVANNLKSLYPEHIKSVLIQAFHNVGFILKLTQLSGGKTDSDYSKKDRILAQYSMTGSIARRPDFCLDNEFKKDFKNLKTLMKDNTLCGYYGPLNEELPPNSYRSKKDGFELFQWLTGVETGGGGGGAYDFRYSLNIFVNEIPELKEKYLQHKSLKEKRNRFTNRKKDLIAEYNKSHKVSLLHSDITYLSIKDNIEENVLKRDKIVKEIQEAQKVLIDREAFLVETDPMRKTEPEEEYLFDTVELDNLSQLFPA